MLAAQRPSAAGSRRNALSRVSRVGKAAARRRRVRSIRRRRSSSVRTERRESALERRLVWIFGSRRAGGERLLSQICGPLVLDSQSPTGYRAPNATARPTVIPVDDFMLATHLAPALGEPVERDRELWPATLNNYLGGKPSYAFSTHYEDVWRPGARRLALARLDGTLELAARGQSPPARDALLAINQLSGSHAADLVMSLFPRSRLLVVMREPTAVVGARLVNPRARWPEALESAPELNTAEERDAWISAAAKEWACAADALSRAVTSHADSLTRVLRYEDLRARPADVLRGLLDWLGLPTPTSESAERPPVAREPPDPRSELSEAELGRIRSVVGGRAAAFGYEA